jgi:chromosome segregation ATPase
LEKVRFEELPIETRREIRREFRNVVKGYHDAEKAVWEAEAKINENRADVDDLIAKLEEKKAEYRAKAPELKPRERAKLAREIADTTGLVGEARVKIVDADEELDSSKLELAKLGARLKELEEKTGIKLA